MIFPASSPESQTKKFTISLRGLLIVPFLIQLAAITSLVGYLSFRNSQESVQNLVLKLQNESSIRVQQFLSEYMSIPKKLNQINVDTFEAGLIQIDDFSQMERAFWKQVQVYPVGYINYANEDGEFIGVAFDSQDSQHIIIDTFNRSESDKMFRYRSDSKGNRLDLFAKPEQYEFATQPWYADAAAAGQPVWSQIYQWAGGGGHDEVLATSCSYPVYDATGTFLGVMGIDMTLSQISDFLLNLKVSPSGRVFIVEYDGLLVANSTEQPPTQLVEGQPQRVSALDSSDAVIQATTEHLQSQYGGFSNIKVRQGSEFWLAGDRYFVEVTPWQDELGLDWLVVMAIPESDFMGQINANTRTTVFLCLGALVVATILGLYTSQWIAQPILGLCQAAKSISGGNLNQRVSPAKVKELGVLAEAFNGMAQQLRDSFAALAQSNQALEQRVTERTAELSTAKISADRANEAKSEFLANMSHELRTPLNAILGFTQIMTRSQTLPIEHQESVGIINRSGEHLLTLINNVLDLSKIEAGHITLNEKNFDLHRLLDDIHDMFQLKASDKGLQLFLEPADNLPRYIRTDEVKLRQILINLINNALKFTEQGGISIRASHQPPTNNQQPTTLHFEVEDTGAGIAPEELNKLFEAFTQTASGTQAQEGTGLGLSISRKFAKLMGGEMLATSRVGEGTVFSFKIQCLEVEAADVEALSTQRRIIALEPGQPRYRILIVDDKPVNRQLLIHLHNPLGFELKEASNGKEAIEMWEQWEPHLIWMDMRMPVMDGFAATQKIKASTKGQATAIIALTASVLEEERAVVLSAGCDDFIRKPFRDEQIFQALEQHLGIRYIYEQSASVSEDKVSQEEVLTAENLQALSPELQVQLRQAVISASKKEVTAVVAAIEGKNPALSEAIATCFHNFEYDKILRLIPKEEV
ncbi:ATP-binding protein [Lusitaniella coriacea]|uniref:hybrid sensor histidine kinase/response regulator n=1 Tax=Lusitaniella coriacea TaxID=1983105 RepID=UPI003CE7323E